MSDSDTIVHNTAEQKATEANRLNILTDKTGFWFYFQDGEDEIAFFGSAWSGMESVFINDNPVSEFRNWKFNSSHEFTHNAKKYKLVFQFTNVLKSQIKCTLYIDGELFGEQDKAVIANKGKISWIVVTLLFLFGVIFGYTTVKLIIWLSGLF